MRELLAKTKERSVALLWDYFGLDSYFHGLDQSNYSRVLINTHIHYLNAYGLYYIRFTTNLSSNEIIKKDIYHVTLMSFFLCLYTPTPTYFS